MDEYRPKITRAYLEVEPQKYTVPIKAVEFTSVSMLKPEANLVGIYKYPSEHTVVLEGNNLWFCHEVRLGEKEKKFTAKNSEAVIGRSIQFNYEPTEKSDQLVTDKKVKVALHSHFANPIRKKVPVEQEPFSFSLRQIQLAKHTPSEIIMLALSCAMLEHYSDKPSESVPSQRFKEITSFLEEAVQVVPIESIIHAIGYHIDLDVAVQCAKALLHAEPNIPCSRETLVGLIRATVRMRTGLHGSVYDQICSNTLKQFPWSSAVVLTAPNRDELQVTLTTPVIGVSPTLRLQEIGKQNINQRIPLLPAEKDNIFHPRIANQLETFSERVAEKKKTTDAVCELSIQHVYPVHSERREAILKSPINVLADARREIASLLESIDEDLDSSTQGTQASNEQVLALVKDITENNFKVCASLIGGFMEQQIRIPLLKSVEGTAYLLSETSSPVAMGAWALFSLSFGELQQMVAGMQGDPLLVEIADYISIISSDEHLKKSSYRNKKYAGKLQFLLQGMRNKTITCSSKYISYSLERQLCSNLKFDKKISVNKLISDWDKIFKGDALSLVAQSHRSLVARWLKWAVLVHDLRESLAKYTCVGVTGLINSGKSYLVSKLFDIQIKVGTTNIKRTTVPILYNLDGRIKGLDVIDFPGVDDKDHSIPEMAQLLLSLSQIVIFVVDYRRVSSDPCKQWLEYLKKEEVPVIVCFTFADRLYVECVENSPDKSEIKTKIGLDLESKRKDIGALSHPSLYTNFYSFHLPVDAAAMFNRKDLKAVGIDSIWDVGCQMVEILEKKNKQNDLAKELRSYLDQSKNKTDQITEHDD